MSAPKFKVGDRVRVVRQINDSAPKGRCGTVMEISRNPWIWFDDCNKSAYEPRMEKLGIPEGHAGVSHQDNLEPITKDTMNDELKVTKAAVLEAASKCSTAKATLQVLFPEVFKHSDEPFKFGEEYEINFSAHPGDTRPLLIGKGIAPDGLSEKCLVVNHGWEMRQQQHDGFVILTFHRKP